MQLRDYQRDACDAAFDSLKAGRGNPLIDLPTGSGKSLVLAEMARRAVQDYAGRVVILAHRKELLSQNVAKVRALGLTAGVYSAGLGQRNTEADVVVAGIQSIHKQAHWLGRRHMVLIDEAHLTPKSDVGMYRSFLADLEKYNPRLRIVGLTATPFRLDSGKLWGDGELFSHVCYRGDIRWMIAQGYLCQLVNKPSEYEIDTSKLHTKYGEFVKSEAESLFSQSNNVAATVSELCKLTAGRKSILVFCSGVSHAEVAAEAIGQLTGEEVGVVTGETPPLERAATLERFGSGGLRWLCNVDVLCLDEQTEILCRDGWCSIDEMNKDKLVASWHFDGSITFDKPKAIVKRPVMEGEVFATLKTNAVDIRVTSNHRMIVSSGQQDKKWDVKQARELFGKRIRMPAHGWAKPDVLASIYEKTEDKKRKARIRSLTYVYKKRHAISNADARLMAESETNRKESITKKLPSDLTQDECMLIGFWVGDGTKSCGRVAISQSMAYPDNIEFIDRLLKKVGIDHSRKKYKPAAKTAHESIRWTLARGTGSCEQKRNGYYPIEDYLDKDGSDLFWGLSSEQFSAVLYGWWLADGLHHSKRQLTTVACSNKKLIDKMQAIATCRGIRTSVRTCSPPRSDRHSQQWVMSWCTAKKISICKNTFKPEQPKPNERAWCVTSLTGNIVTRRNGRVAVVGNTTGFDSPRVDCVAILRATQSAGLFCQIVGRGLRVHPSKQDCLVLDFGGNLKRHGPIDAVDFGRQRATGTGGERPQKTCPGCGDVVAATVRVCECGFRFADPKPRHETQADDESQLFSEPKQLKIRDWSFNRHVKKSDPDAPNTLRVTYYPEGNLERPVDEWVCLNHEGFALRRALTWWGKHSDENIVEVAEALDLDKVDAAIHMYDRGFVRRPKEITVVQNGRWWRVTDRVDGELEQRVEEVPF